MKNVKVCIVSLIVSLLSSTAMAETFLLDDFESPGNALFSKEGVYKRDPSDAKKGSTTKEAFSGEKSLYIAYKKEAEGFCGYYIHLKANNRFFDGTKYTKITFMVKGKEGGEKFQLGLADKAWFEIDDSVKSPNIGEFLPAKNKDAGLTTEWQKAEIPLQAFVDIRSGDFDLTQLGAMAFCFEPACFEDGTGKGVIYIDDISFE